ncbi:ATP-citrate synthase beta chain protein 2-like [Malus sylvestris]|uniref:ATP-citrate synthase beta chain protein 2-like n=1 Tax=Malus sylvestris TaxID=3752 RepID=UPI0021AD1885|nr:ATP-citrate synthase beta chain protein 2-like [Malus sylvestris]XP_050105704.1 ATP-citrate synthase beta chain protein 2-like [Malus sylvestris]XP_050105705.1 ATP-citrate synthase beta chain protein 2-like [Malus sylvestris]
MVKLAFSISFSNPHCLFRLADSHRPCENDGLASILSSSRRRLPSLGRVLCVCGHHQLLDSLTPVLRDFKSYFSVEEIAIPVHSNIEASYAAHPIADVFINFASYRSAAASSMAALKQPTIRVVAIIAEGVPESDTKQLIAYARATNKVVIGSATVGGIQAGAFKIGDTAETINNFIPVFSG